MISAGRWSQKNVLRSIEYLLESIVNLIIPMSREMDRSMLGLEST